MIEPYEFCSGDEDRGRIDFLYLVSIDRKMTREIRGIKNKWFYKIRIDKIPQTKDDIWIAFEVRDALFQDNNKNILVANKEFSKYWFCKPNYSGGYRTSMIDHNCTKEFSARYKLNEFDRQQMKNAFYDVMNNL